MDFEGKTQYSRYRIAYHIVWVTKYRKRILSGKIKWSLENILDEICKQKEWGKLSCKVMPEHIHIFLSAPPQWKPSNIAKLLKGISSRWLLIEYPKLSTYKGRSKLWSPSYFIGTAGNITAETIKRYIEECQDA